MKKAGYIIAGFVLLFLGYHLIWVGPEGSASGRRNPLSKYYHTYWREVQIFFLGHERYARRIERKWKQILKNRADKSLKARQYMVGTAELTNYVRQTVVADTPGFDREMHDGLSSVLLQWFDVLGAGEFDKFFAFRQPDDCVFESHALTRLHYLLKDSVPGLDQLPAKTKCKLLYEKMNTARLELIPDGGLLIKVFSTTNSLDLKDGADPRVDWVLKQIGGTIDETSAVSPYRYKIKPADVYADEGKVDLVVVKGMFVSRGDHLVLPVFSSFFWSPKEKRWKPFECWAGEFHIPPGVPPIRVDFCF